MKVREVLDVLYDDGWMVARTRGDHRQLQHPGKPGVVTVSGNRNDDVAAGTLASIWRQARIRRPDR